MLVYVRPITRGSVLCSFLGLPQFTLTFTLTLVLFLQLVVVPVVFVFFGLQCSQCFVREDVEYREFPATETEDYLSGVLPAKKAKKPCLELAGV